MIDNLLIAGNTFERHRSTLLSVDEILLLRYVNVFTNFRDLQLKVEMSPPCLKHFICLHGGQCLQLLALGYAAGIQLKQVYL